MDQTAKRTLDRCDEDYLTKCEQTEKHFDFDQRGALDLDRDRSQHRRYTFLFDDLMN
ncbi:MAG: hypothetical protein AAF661_16785 [Pseudomonadota bacterium]